jgi:hypothetical protein
LNNWRDYYSNHPLACQWRGKSSRKPYAKRPTAAGCFAEVIIGLAIATVLGSF